MVNPDCISCIGGTWPRSSTLHPVGGAPARPIAAVTRGFLTWYVLGGLGLVTYLATFAPAFLVARNPLTLAELIPHQLVIYAQQTQPLAQHPYQSDWWQWPLIERPIWYLYERVEGVQRGVLLIGANGWTQRWSRQSGQAGRLCRR